MRHARTTIGVLATMAVGAGCGGDAEYANEPRPAAPINVSAVITDGQVTVSPRAFGAGTVVLIVVNQTAKAQRVTVESDELGASTPGIRQQTAPINPQGTATLKLDMARGRYTVSADGKGLAPTKLRVGRARTDSSDELLTP